MMRKMMLGRLWGKGGDDRARSGDRGSGDSVTWDRGVTEDLVTGER